MDAPKAVIIHMGINLRGFNVGVSQHFLQGSQINAAGEQMRRETVPQGMNRQVFRHPGTQGVFLNDSPQLDPIQSASRSRQEQHIAAVRFFQLRPQLAQISRNRFRRRFP